MVDTKKVYEKRADKIIEIVSFFSQKLKEISGRKKLTEEEEIINNLQEAFDEWKRKENYFEVAIEPDLIDHAIYEIEASKIKYIYFLKKARKKGISIEKYL